jgi:hypothetical protein
MCKSGGTRRSINFRILVPAISAAPAARSPASSFSPSSTPRQAPLNRGSSTGAARRGFSCSESTRLGPMGSLMSCLSDPIPSGNRSPPPQPKRRSSTSSRGRGGGGRDSAKASVSIDEEALTAAAALVLGQRGASGGLGAFERSASVRYAAKRQSQGPPLPRSCSTRPRSLADPELQPQQLLAKVRILAMHATTSSIACLRPRCLVQLVIGMRAAVLNYTLVQSLFDFVPSFLPILRISTAIDCPCIECLAGSLVTTLFHEI